MRSLIPFFAIGATALPSGKDNAAANGDNCSRAGLDAIIKANLPSGARFEDYVIRHRVSKITTKVDFASAMCKAAPWQGSGNPYAHVHDASKVDEYKDWIEDNEARDAWILKNGGTDTFPAGSGGFFWCNEKNGAWVQSKDLPNCPHADVKGAWKATADGYNGQDLIINGEPVKTWTTDCVTYFKTGLNKDRAEAKQYCEDQGLQLAQQRNEEEWKLLQGEGTFWMGAVRSDADAHQWVWGEPDSTTDVDCLFWQPGEPNNPHGEKCLHGNWGDGWNDRGCGGGDGVICEKRTCVPSCDHLRVNGREVEGIKSECVTYFKTDKKMKKADAKQFCLDHGLKLATQKNNVEHDLMKDNGKSFWLDGTRSNSDVHQWVWGEADSSVDINKLGCFFWQSGQPDHYGNNENCMHVLTSGLWNDQRCDASYYVTCELRTCDGVCENAPEPIQLPSNCEMWNTEGSDSIVGNDKYLRDIGWVESDSVKTIGPVTIHSDEGRPANQYRFSTSPTSRSGWQFIGFNANSKWMNKRVKVRVEVKFSLYPTSLSRVGVGHPQAHSIFNEPWGSDVQLGEWYSVDVEYQNTHRWIALMFDYTPVDLEFRNFYVCTVE